MLHVQFAEAKNQATTHYNMLDVVYSPGCVTALKNHISTSCPTLDKLAKYDTSNQHYSGKFINGNTSRTAPLIKNHYMMYTGLPNLVICIDCFAPLGSPDLIKTIFIESHDFMYIDHSQIVKNNTYNTYSGRYVSPDCMSATIGYSDSLLNDTIHYMQSGCTITNFNGNKTNTLKDIPFSYKNPYSSLHYNIAKLKANKNSTPNCITKRCETTPDPYKKKGW